MTIGIITSKEKFLWWAQLLSQYVAIQKSYDGGEYATFGNTFINFIAFESLKFHTCSKLTYLIIDKEVDLSDEFFTGIDYIFSSSLGLENPAAEPTDPS